MMTQPQAEQRIKDFPAICRKAGLKVTPQRSAIFSMLTTTKSHPSPEEVYSGIRDATPSISLATVYKILELFHGQGFIRRVSTLDQVTRYDANVDPHHHLICSQCGKIQDVEIEAGSPQPPNPDMAGFRVTDYEVQFHGVCGECEPRG